ncbi:hypothetical protein WLF18_15990 [Pseudomonas shirazensis]|uniref:Uncharacterized protein n=1 Tax=Pseudomonas shirazensis TaxID=2745494 RepID=A0ABU9A1Z9_9PSED
MNDRTICGIDKTQLLGRRSTEDELLGKHITDVVHQHHTLGESLAQLENFGTWMMTLQEAAELIACDQWAAGNVSIPALTEYSGHLLSCEVASQLSNITETFLPKLINAVEIGRLKAARTLRDFDEVIVPSLTFIDYSELCEWLTGRGYTPGEAFDEWYDRAINISDRLIEEAIWLRRAARDEIKAMPVTIGYASIQVIDPEAGVEALSSQLKAALLENHHLRERLAKAESARQETAHNTSKRSHWLATAALIKLMESPIDRPRPQGMKQSAIKSAILERFSFRGLKERNLDEIFSAANKAIAGEE